MKSYNHLYEKFISDENIRLAIINASKGKRDRPQVKRAIEHLDKYVPHYKMIAENFKSPKHEPKEIYDGYRKKKRLIIVPTFAETVIHHMVVQVLSPILSKSFYYHSYGSIPNKGRYKAMKVVKKYIKSGVKYCLQLDIKKFYENISHEILMNKLSKIIHDDRFLKVLAEIINATDSGLPLGFYTSQWFANFYLTGLDHYIKENLQAPFYIRYMDDMIILSNNKRKLHRMRRLIGTYLKELDLKLKENYQVYPIDKRALDFLGFRFFRNRVILRKSILYRIIRKINKVRKKDKITIYDARQLIAYIGNLKHIDVYSIYLDKIKPYVTFSNLRNQISRKDKELCLKSRIA